MISRLGERLKTGLKPSFDPNNKVPQATIGRRGSLFKNGFTRSNGVKTGDVSHCSLSMSLRQPSRLTRGAPGESHSQADDDDDDDDDLY